MSSAIAAVTSLSKRRSKALSSDNLFFVGGSVNPGAGMPMVTLSGQHVARMIIEQAEAGA